VSATRSVNSAAARFAAVATNVVCISYYNIMPLVLGGAADSHGIAEGQLGFAAAAFMGGLALINFTGFAWIRRFDWRLLVLGGNALAALAFLAPTAAFSYPPWVACNLLAGLATGVSYGVSIASLGDTADPERNFALAYAAQTFVSAGMIFALPRLPLGFDLFTLGQGAAAAMMLAGLLPAFLLPRQGTKGGHAPAANSRRVVMPRAALTMALFVLLLNVMAEGAIWAFVERIAVSGNLTTEFAATVMAFSFFASGAGSIIAATIATRFGSIKPFIAAVCMSIASVWVLWLGKGQAMFFAGIMLFALAWNLGSPYRMALATRADASGRFATFVPAMQTLGAALGPAAAGLLVINGSFVLVYAMCTVAWLATIVLFLDASKRIRS
jgi:predicted MFS family arabinose efflux permease